MILHLQHYSSFKYNRITLDFMSKNIDKREKSLSLINHCRSKGLRTQKVQMVLVEAEE